MTEPIAIPPPGQRQELSCDVAIIGGGTAGTMAAITAAEITRANEGIVNQRAVYQTASRGHDMVQRLERYGVKFA
jgi:succinate dehydrogenase/fumarate reductase flavoprotein subunit